MKSPLARFRLPSERPAGSGDFAPKILDGTLAASTALLWTLPWPPWNMSYRWRVSFSERENEQRTQRRVAYEETYARNRDGGHARHRSAGYGFRRARRCWRRRRRSRRTGTVLRLWAELRVLE